MTDPHFHKDYRIEEKDLVPNGSYISVVPDYPAPEGTRVNYLNGSDYRLYIMLDGAWRQIGGNSINGIHFDNSAIVTASGGVTQTTAYTVTGDDPILFIAIAGYFGDAPTAVSYNGIALTLVDVTPVTTTGYICYLYVLRGASAGTHNISITMSGSHGNLAIAASYANTDQTAQPDASSVGGTTTTAHYTQSVTSVTNQCLAVMAGIYDSGNTLVADSGTVLRQTAGSVLYLCDSATPKAAGSITLGLTSLSQQFTGVAAAFKPN